jgi:hypothetical protein
MEEIMNQRHSRSLIMALVVLTVITLLPGTMSAAPASVAPCTMETVRTPAARAELWRKSLDSFAAGHPGLTAEQGQLLDQAVSLGDEIATLKQDASAQAAFGRKASLFMERARKVLSNNELGELFTGMGQTQVWLAEMVASVPYCNCSTNGGACTMGGGGPSGTCQSGCVSWDGDTGTRYSGMCGAAQ